MTTDFYKRPLFLILIIYSLCLALFLPVPKPKSGDASFLIKPFPQDITLKVLSYPAKRKNGLVFTAEILSVAGKPSKGGVYVQCAECEELFRGDEVKLNGVLEPVFSADNYGSFNWREYLARRHIFSVAEVKEVLSVKSGSWFWRVLSKTRASMLKVFEDNIPASSAAVLSGVAIGEKSDMDKGLYAAFQDSGAIHLLVASGGNVGFVTLMVYFLCSLFFMGRYIPAAAALLCALLYTLIAGADAPLIRAYIMTLCATLGLLLGRKSGVLQGFLTAAFLILLFNPQSVFDAGFQMSFLATLAIIYFVCNFNFVSRLPKTAAWAAGLFLVSLSAQLALVPVFTNYFNRLSFAAVISNIFLVPLSGVLMGGAFLLWPLYFLPFSFPFEAVLWVMKILLFVFNFLVEAFAATPLAGIELSSWNFGFVAAYYTVLFALFNFPLFKNKKLFLGLTFALALCLLSGGILANRSFTAVLEGRYSRALFAKDKNKIILIGAGVDGKTVKSAVLAAGSKSIDCLFIPSVYKSAAYALKDLDGIKIKDIYVPGGELSPESKKLIEASGANVHLAAPGGEYCGVTVQKPWYGSGYVREDSSPRALSFSYGGYDFSASMKTYKKDGELFLYN